MIIGIVGNGVVGHATARVFIEHVREVRVYDLLPERRLHGLEETLASDLVFLCLPTPQSPASLQCDTSVVEDVCRVLGGTRPHGHYALRSTVPIGFTRRMAERYKLPHLVHSPEFLTARCAVTDAHLPARHIIGYPWESPRGGPWKRIPGTAGGCPLAGLYERRFPGLPIHLLTSDESEAVKLLQNSFFAVKIAFWNEVNALAVATGLDWDAVLGAILADGRIARSHTNVPGPDGVRGFGGTCLPKDLASLAHQITAVLGPGAAPVLTAALTRNESDRRRIS